MDFVRYIWHIFNYSLIYSHICFYAGSVNVYWREYPMESEWTMYGVCMHWRGGKSKGREKERVKKEREILLEKWQKCQGTNGDKTRRRLLPSKLRYKNNYRAYVWEKETRIWKESPYSFNPTIACCISCLSLHVRCISFFCLHIFLLALWLPHFYVRSGERETKRKLTNPTSNPIATIMERNQITRRIDSKCKIYSFYKKIRS